MVTCEPEWEPALARMSMTGTDGDDDAGVTAVGEMQAWLPVGYSQILRLYVFGPAGLRDYGSAMLRCKI